MYCYYLYFQQSVTFQRNLKMREKTYFPTFWLLLLFFIPVFPPSTCLLGANPPNLRLSAKSLTRFHFRDGSHRHRTRG